MYKTVITDCNFGQIDNERRLLSDISEIGFYQCKTEDEVISVAKNADALIIQHAPITARVIDTLDKCRVISRYGVGTDTIDVEAASRRNIPVVNVPDYCVDEVADHTCALILDLVRKVTFSDRYVHHTGWELGPFKPIFGLRGALLGIVGFGHIAQNLARKMSVFGLDLIVYDPFVADETIAGAGARRSDLDELFSSADIISLHAPLTKDTHHLIGTDLLARMKDTAVLVNTSRGALIDGEALYEALSRSRPTAAAIDVAEEEPVPRGSKLLHLDNLVMTPHTAFYSEASLTLLQIRVAEAVRERLKYGTVPRHALNADRIQGR